MSFGEKLYLAGVLFAFGSFIVLMGTLCWLDARDDRIKPRRERAKQASSSRPGTFIGAAAVHR